MDNRELQCEGSSSTVAVLAVLNFMSMYYLSDGGGGLIVSTQPRNWSVRHFILGVYFPIFDKAALSLYTCVCVCVCVCVRGVGGG
jgi:hypothetical protein